MRTSWLRALILVVVLVGGVITPVAPVGDAQAAPSGFVTVADANVHEDLPVDKSLPISKEDLEGSVMVSDNASTTEIVLTTGDRAREYLDNGSTVGGNEIALVIQDDTNHAGREVAIPADAIKGALGRVPEAVHGTHEDGSEWTSQVRAESGLLIFEVPHFSSNSITFSGDVSMRGTYTDGSSVSYDINSVDAVSNFSINVTGSTSSEWENKSVTDAARGGVDIGNSIAGNAEPLGPDNGNPKIEVTGSARSESHNLQLDENRHSFTSEQKYGYVASYMVEITSDTSGDGSGSESYDYALVNADNGNTLHTGSMTVQDDGSYDSGQATHTLEMDIPPSSLRIELRSNTDNGYIGIAEFQSGKPDNVMVSTLSESHSFGALSGMSSTRLNMQTGETLTLSYDHGKVDIDAHVQERSKTTDPAVDVNGHTTSHGGVVEEGSTVSLSTNDSWIDSGTNTVNVSTGGSLSADAPTPEFDLDYRHETADEIEVSYTSEGWTERYNVSRTFASNQENATVTVPYQGSVTQITQIEEQVDSGSWSDVPESRYSLSDGVLTVQLEDGDGDDDVDSGTEIGIRTTGRYVVPVNGDITVTDPILLGEDHDVEFRVDSKSSGFYIDLSNVANPGLRYTYQESWSNPDSHMIVTASGDKRLMLPNAAAGDSARVALVPLIVSPVSGDTKVSVADPDEPTITMGPGSSSGDDITITYRAASTGTTYKLYSTSRDRVVAKKQADAGTVSFKEDDSTESLMINTTNSDGGGAGGMFGDTSQAADYGTERPVLVMGALAALVVGLVWATGRTGLRGRSRWGLVGAVSVALGLISLEALNPGSISRYVGDGIQELISQVGTVVPLAGIAAVTIVGYMVVSWWQSRKADASTPDTKVTFSLGDKKK